MIRICAMIAVRDGIRSWGAVTEELIAAVAAPDVEATLRDLPDAPITMVMTREDHDLVAPHNVQAAMDAERAGFDAITTGCLLDPGIEEMKRAVDRLIVIGDCQAVMHMGTLLGQRVTFLLPSKTTMGRIRHDKLEELIDQYGFTRNLASLRGVPVTSLDFAADHGDLPDPMLAQARLAISEDGADVIVGYGGLRVINYLRANLPVPVLESVQCTISLATELVRHRDRVMTQ